MSKYKSEFLNVLTERGFIHQMSDAQGLDALFAKETVSAYIGFDPTAPSLHAGSLIQIMMLSWMQKTGHKPVALMGGGTGMVGDPSFKDEARKLMTADTIASNLAGIKRIFSKYITFGDGKTDGVMVNNADWLLPLNYLEFLRDVGQYFSVNRMLSFESVKQRLDREQSLSFLEFNYMILQAYDFVELNKRYGVRLQMGGSDQWGNIINGIDLGHRMATPQLYALTSPLLTTSSGGKMGKTAQGAVWLNAEALPAYDYWQYWRNTEDADVGRFLKLYTFLPMDEIARLEALGGAEINEAKKILATEVTRLCHGDDAAKAAEETARTVFEQGGAGGDLPVVTIPQAELEAGIALIDLLVRVSFASSKGEARRLIQSGGAYVNDAKIEADTHKCTAGDLGANGAIKISSGKKKHALVRPA